MFGEAILNEQFQGTLEPEIAKRYGVQYWTANIYVIFPRSEIRSQKPSEWAFIRDTEEGSEISGQYSEKLQRFFKNRIEAYKSKVKFI